MSSNEETISSLEDTFRLSASAEPVQNLKRKKTPRLRRDMSRKMNEQIHKIFVILAKDFPVLGLYTMNYDNSAKALDEGKATLRFSIPRENRLYDHQVPSAREGIEEILNFLVKCCPDKDGLRLDAQPSKLIYDLEYKHNSLIDALYNFIKDVMAPDKELTSHLFLAGHILDRIEDYKPANKLN